MELVNNLREAGFLLQADVLEKLRCPSIRIETESAGEESFRLGESKIGGMPHLPEDFEWPLYGEVALGFIAQFNLTDIAPFDVENKLPHEGILYFFYEGGEEVWGYDPKDKGGFVVFHHKGDINKLKITEHPDTVYEFAVLSPCKLTFKLTSSYPMGEVLDGVGLSEEVVKEFSTIKRSEMKQYDRIIDEYTDENYGGHQLLGYPTLVQGEIFRECQLVSNGLYCGDESGYNDPKAKILEKNTSDWTLLFQIDSDENADVMWGDCGMVYFAIKKDDLVAENFENIWAVFQCC